MKTYKTIIEKPLLKIMHDDSPESPREWSNLGYLITVEKCYISPDNNKLLFNIISTTQNEVSNIEQHMEAVKREYENATDEKVLVIYPITKYEHSNVKYFRGVRKGFDYSLCGMYVITDKTQKEIGVEPKDFEKVVDAEIEVYNHYVNCEVYGFELRDEEGSFVDSCWGFYDIEEIREHLPQKWEDEDLNDYLVD